MGIDMTYLAHHGIKGQKWGVRRYQNEDGTLTPEGEARYNTAKEYQDALNEAAERMYRAGYAHDETATKLFYLSYSEQSAKVQKLIQQHNTTLDKIDKDGDDAYKDVQFLIKKMMKDGRFDYKTTGRYINLEKGGYKKYLNKSGYKTYDDPAKGKTGIMSSFVVTEKSKADDSYREKDAKDLCGRMRSVDLRYYNPYYY